VDIAHPSEVTDYHSVLWGPQKRAGSDQLTRPDHFPQNDPIYLNLTIPLMPINDVIRNDQ